MKEITLNSLTPCWSSVPVYFKDSSPFSLYSNIACDRFQEVVRCCQPDPTLKNQKSRFASPLFRGHQIESLHSNSPLECDLCYDFFFTFVSLPGNGNRSEKRIFIFSPAICKALWTSKKMLRITKCKSIIYHNDRF